MRETMLEMPPANQLAECSSSATDRSTLGIGPRDASLMTSVGLAAGEVLTEVDVSGAVTLRQLIRKLDWPVHLVMMAVGVLVRQGLVRATQRELEVLVEPISECSSIAQAEVV